MFREKSSTIRTQSPIQVIVMLYDNALFSLRTSKAAILAGDKATQVASVQRSEQILQAIMGCLDVHGSEMAVDLKTLYGYMLNELSMAHEDKTTTRIERCESILRDLRKVWVSLEVSAKTSLPKAA